MFRIKLQLDHTTHDDSTRHVLPPEHDASASALTAFPPTHNGAHPSFGREMRGLFNFGPGYVPLNHGSFGTYPRALLEHRLRLLRDWEERECIFTVFDFPRLLHEARAAVAPLLGATADEIAFIPNATTGFNTILRNLPWAEGDVVVFPETIYSSCRNTILSLEETTPVRGHELDVAYPIEDDELVARFRAAAADLRARGRRVRAAVFDTIASRPGVRVPWERLVAACRELGVLSIIDAAHGIGHLDMTHTGTTVQPDFLITNCHKWFFTPRPAAILYVPLHNQHLLTTALPTSHGYLPPSGRRAVPTESYFASLFANGATIDGTPYLTVPAALHFRTRVCGGEARIRSYCAALARAGGDLVARALGTEVMDNRAGTLRAGVAFANVRMPIHVAPRGFGRGMIPTAHGDGRAGTAGAVAEEEVGDVLRWWFRTAADEYGTYFQTYLYGGAIWTRLSAQVYLEERDFVWAAGTLKEMCRRVAEGEWRGGEEGEGEEGEGEGWECVGGGDTW